MTAERDVAMLTPDELADLAMQLDFELQTSAAELPLHLLPSADQPLRRSRAAALMLEISVAIRGLDRAWLKDQLNDAGLGITDEDRLGLLKRIFDDRVEERRPAAWTEFSDFGFSSDELKLAAAVDRAHLGQLLGDDLRLEERVAVGGVAVVYRAACLRDGRAVAVKIPLRVADDHDDEHAQRILEEAAILRRLTCDGVPRLVEFRQEAFGPVLLMEWIETGGAAGIPGDFSHEQKLHVVSEVARIVDRVHRLDLIHGDVKAGNILVDQQRKAWLIDFNVTRSANPQENRDGPLPGTRVMMSQEALVGVAADADISQDIYALGALLYQTVTGSPFIKHGTREEALIAAVLKGGTEAPEFPDGIPELLQKIVQSATTRHVHLRFATALDLADTLARFLDDSLAATDIPPKRRTLLAWQLGAKIGLCMTRIRKMRQSLETPTDVAPTEPLPMSIRNGIGFASGASIAADDVLQLAAALDCPLPRCSSSQELMMLFYRNRKLTVAELPTITAAVESFEAWLREVLTVLEAQIAPTDSRAYLLLTIALQSRLAPGSSLARENLSRIAASAGVPGETMAAFAETIAGCPTDEDWASALQRLDFEIIKWLRWGDSLPAER